MRRTGASKTQVSVQPLKNSNARDISLVAAARFVDVAIKS
jgi:hypothetical protein